MPIGKKQWTALKTGNNNLSKIANIEKLWELQNERLVIDVRTPAEFEKGHIPGAINIPLFSNEERVVVGTAYKQVNPEEALMKGLDFVGPKMTSYIREAKNMCPNRKVLVHCWRGGKRSFSMGWLLGIAGFDVMTLEGGYKAYRNFIHQAFSEKKLNMLVLGGRTGCGKTSILHAIEKKEQQFIDLEGMANHKGSAFGGIGENPQPTIESFENYLYETIRKFDTEKIIWLENESRNIGRVFIHEGFWKQFKKAPLINIELPFDRRVEHLVEQYGQSSIPDLKDSFKKIQKRLGGLSYQEAIEALDRGEIDVAASIALSYYDKSYQYMLENNETPDIHLINFESESFDVIADRLIAFANEHFVVNPIS